MIEQKTLKSEIQPDLAIPANNWIKSFVDQSNSEKK